MNKLINIFLSEMLLNVEHEKHNFIIQIISSYNHNIFIMLESFHIQTHYIKRAMQKGIKGYCRLIDTHG